MKATEKVKKNVLELEAKQKELSADKSQEDSDLVKELNQAKALLRNLNLLILDIFKEFDQVIEKFFASESAKVNKDATHKKLTISREAIVSLTQVLSQQEIDKKQLQSLGRAFLLISKHSHENWALVHGEF